MYSNDPAGFVNAAIYFWEQLDSRGYEAAESHITEWNTTFSERKGKDDPALRMGAKGAALMTAAWIGLQKQGVDVSLFYRGTDPSLDLPTSYGLFFADGRPKRTAMAVTSSPGARMHRGPSNASGCGGSWGDGRASASPR